MPEPVFNHLKVKEVDGVAIVDLVDADIVYASSVVQEIGQELRSLLKDHSFKNVLLNFNGVQYIASSMLGQLARLQKEMDAIRGQLKLAGLGPTLKDIFQIGH